MTTSMTEKQKLPEVTTLPPLDEAEVAALAERLHAEMLAARPTAPRERLAHVAQCIEAASKNLASARARRNAAAYTVATQYRVRRGASMPAALGFGRNRWKVIRDQMAAEPPKPVPDALAALPSASLNAAAYTRLLDVLYGDRVEAIAALKAAEDVSNVEVAELVGCHPGRVAHLVAQTAS